MTVREKTIDGLRIIDNEAERSKSIKPAPAEAEEAIVRALVQGLTYLNQQGREIDIQRGITYVMLKQMYQEYCQVSYAGGMKKTDIMNYREFKAQFGMGLDKNSTVSDLTSIVDRYVFDYGWADFRIVTREDEPDLDWHDAVPMLDENGQPVIDVLSGEPRYESEQGPETVRVVITRIDPLLLKTAKYKLLQTRPYHNSSVSARLVLDNQEIDKKRGAGVAYMNEPDFILWKETTPKLAELEQLKHSDLADIEDDPEPSLPFSRLNKVSIPVWQLQEGLTVTLDTLLEEAHKLPPLDTMIGNVTITVTVKGKIAAVPVEEGESADEEEAED